MKLAVDVFLLIGFVGYIGILFLLFSRILKKHTLKFRRALEFSDDSFFSFDANKDQLQSLKSGNLKFLGYNKELPPTVLEILREHVRKSINEANSPCTKFQLQAFDQSAKRVQLKVRPLGEDKSANQTYLVLVSEIPTPSTGEGGTEKENMRLVQMERYTILRDLGAGISHEINNPLAIILGRTQTLKIKLSRGPVDPDFVIEVLEKIEGNVKRISRIVNALRMMTKDGSNEEEETFPLLGVFEDLASVWAERLKNKGYDFQIEALGPEIEIRGRRSLLMTALFNLISNSYDATHEMEKPWIQISFKVTDDEVKIRLTDCGSGIPIEVQKRMFDPFYTTHETVKSSGLGLSVTRGILEMHKGKIEYDSAVGNTSFVLTIPRFKTPEELAA